MTAPASPPANAAPRQTVARRFGRFELHELVGRSQRTMAWKAFDPRVAQELIVVMPRVQPADDDAAQAWEQAARKAARLNHPNLAHAVEVGLHERWPFVAYDVADAVPLPARIGAQGLPAREAAAFMVQAGQGLAFAHEAGARHGDLQSYLLFVADTGPNPQLRVLGIEIALLDVLPAAEAGAPAAAASAAAAPRATTLAGATRSEVERLREQRAQARRDVLSLGLVLQHALSGQWPLEEADLGKVVLRMPPAGRESVRLPWSTARPIPEPLRAIANRATDRQERQRYRSARTLVAAFEGWLEADAANGGGPLALLADRLHSVGVLPAMPGAAERAARLALMERERTNELAEIVLQDLALSFELLRAVNTAQVRGALLSGSGPVLTVRRAIAMVGLDGVRRVALGLRPWPGPLDERAAAELERLISHAKRAAKLARLLRPAGYDAEVVSLVALMQSLGRLTLHYHFADEARQIRRLMQPAPAAAPGEAAEPGMNEEQAAFAVLGIDIEALAHTVARHWGLDEGVMHMIRRLPASTAVRAPDSDGDMLRAIASCAHEALEAAALPTAQSLPALDRVAKRYGRTLNLTLRDPQQALQPGALARADQATAAEGELESAAALLPDEPSTTAAAALDPPTEDTFA